MKSRRCIDAKAKKSSRKNWFKSFLYFYFAKQSSFCRMKTKTFLVLLLTIVSVGMLSFRMILTQTNGGIGLVWNLFLAWMPLFLAKMTEIQWQQQRLSRVGLAGGLLAWLLFFPNAPYLITDLIHLKAAPDHLLWYDSLMSFSFALAGLMAGLYSMLKIHRLVEYTSQRSVAWGVMAGSVVVSSFGIYLGRYGRWNSWDILTHPFSLFRYIVRSLRESLAIQTTLAFSFAIGFIYLAFWIYAHLEPKHEQQ
jgi:uncharacterized membrane protein